MDTERAMLTKVVSTGSIESAISRGVEIDHFANEDNADVYDYLVRHLKKYKIPPTIESFQEDNPDFELSLVEDALDYLLDKFINTVRYRMAVDKLRDLAERVDDPTNWDSIDLTFFEVARDLATIAPTTKASFFSEMDRRTQEYERMLEEGETEGIPFGLPSIDDKTGGIQDHEMVIVAGWQGLGKSTLMMFFALSAYMAGYTPLIFSLEMKQEAIYRKFDAMVAKLNYSRLKSLNLDDDEIKEWKKAAKTAKKAKHDIIVVDDMGRVTVDKIIAETVKYKPDLVIVDYLSLLEVPRSMGQSWETIKYLTRELKLAAKTLETPIMAAAQTNRSSAEEGAKLENLSFGPTIGMDADIVIGLFQDEEMLEEEKMEVRLNKNRDGPKGKCTMKWSYTDMEFHEMDFADVWKSRKNGNLVKETEE